MINLRLQITSQRFLSAVSGFVLWLLVAGSLTLWWLHMPKPDVEGVAVTQSSLGDMRPVSSQDSVARALGLGSVDGAIKNAPGRFKLLGVIASENGAGAALISVDSQQPARSYVVGQSISESLTVQSVGKNLVVLVSRDGVETNLELKVPD